MMPAVLNRRLHGTLVAGVDMMQLATVQTTWQRTHATTAARQLSVDFSRTDVDRYTCSHGLDAVVWRISRACSIRQGYCDAMPPP